jgi:hypothetical protein
VCLARFWDSGYGCGRDWDVRLVAVAGEDLRYWGVGSGLMAGLGFM